MHFVTNLHAVFVPPITAHLSTASNRHVAVRFTVKAPKPKRGRWKRAFSHVGDNLYRSDATGIYYAFFKRNGKEIRRSLRATDKELARRMAGTQGWRWSRRKSTRTPPK